MSRVSDLENKVAALERNVGMLAKEEGLDDCLMISDCSSISKYRDGIESGCAPVKNDKGATKIALVINKKGGQNKVVSNKYVIHEDYYFEDGDGLKVYIEEGHIVFEARAEEGYGEFEWKCDIESFKKHITRYEQDLTKIKKIDILNT